MRSRFDLSYFYRNRKMRGSETQVFVAHAVARDKFLERAKFIPFPARVVYVFVEQDNGSRDDARRKTFEHGDRRGVKVGIDVQKTHRPWMACEKRGQGVVKPSRVQFD